MVLTNVKFTIVEKFERRNYGGEKYVKGMVTLSVEDGAIKTRQSQNKNGVFACYGYSSTCEEKVLSKLEELIPKQRVVMTKVLEYPNSFRLTSDSKIISNVSNFKINEELVEKYIRPDVVSITEAKGSPSKRRMSVYGDVVKVEECAKTETYKRRCIMMEGEGATMEVVLWGETAAKSLSCVKALITAVVKDGKRLVSTGSSKTETSPELSEEESGVVIGVGDKESGFPIELVLETGELLLLDEVVEFNYDVELPINIKYRTRGEGHVESIRIEHE